MKDGGLTVAELRPDHEAVAVPMDARMRAVVLMAFYNFFLADDVCPSANKNQQHTTVPYLHVEIWGNLHKFPALSPLALQGYIGTSKPRAPNLAILAGADTKGHEIMMPSLLRQL